MKNVVTYINNLIEHDELWKFYKRREWKELSKQILEENHYECTICKSRGIITRYDVSKNGKRTLIKTVHHVKHVRDNPELALSRYYYENGEKKKQLIPVCKKCHNQQHPEKGSKAHKQKEKFMNEERW